MSLVFIADLTLLALLLVSAIGAVVSKSLLNSTILLGIFSLLMAAQYLVLAAPDVAITEAAVGAGISTILFLLCFVVVGDRIKKSKSLNALPFIICFFVAGVLLFTTIDMPAFGSGDVPSQKHLIPYFFENAQSDTGIPNMVTSILASYRGFDTLGETTVVFTAIVAVLLLIGTLKGERGNNE